jgi:hypothetical protein
MGRTIYPQLFIAARFNPWAPCLDLDRPTRRISSAEASGCCLSSRCWLDALLLQASGVDEEFGVARKDGLMKILAIAAALALAACGQSATQAPAGEAAPTQQEGLMGQALAMAPEQQPVFAWQTLSAYQAAHPETQPPCASVRSAESRGLIPDDVAPDSIYGPYAGALVFAVQCGSQLTTVQSNPLEHWLVILAPGATEAVVVNCADAAGDDRCSRDIPRAGEL